MRDGRRRPRVRPAGGRPTHRAATLHEQVDAIGSTRATSEAADGNARITRYAVGPLVCLA